MSSPKIFTAHLRELSERIDRFDASYWLPEFREQRLRLERCGFELAPLSRFISSLESGTGIYDLSEDAGWHYINVNNITPMGINDANCGFVPSPPDENSTNTLRLGDVVTGRVGTIGIFCKYTLDVPAYISDNVFRIRLKDCNADYILAVLNSSIVQNQIEREAKGSLQLVVNKQAIRNLLIPIPPHEVQERIVSKLNAAYIAKRKADEKAAELLASIDDVVLEALGIPPLPPPDTSLSARIFTVSSRDVTEKRLDAIAYQSIRRKFLKNVKDSSYPIQSIGTLVEVKRLQTDTLTGQVYVGMENIDGNTGEFMPSENKETISSGILFQEGDILVPRLRPYLNKIWHATFDGVASTEFYPFVAQGVSAAFLAIFLRTKMISNVLTMLMTGNTLPRVQIEDVLALPIPVPPESAQEEIVTKVSAIRAEVKAMKSDAVEHLAAAKSCIEKQLLN